MCWFCKSVEGNVSLLFYFDTETWAHCHLDELHAHLDDDWQCLLKYGKPQSRSMAGPPRQNFQLNLSCPWPGCLGYLQVVKWQGPKRGCEKLCPSSGSHWGFHTFPSGALGRALLWQLNTLNLLTPTFTPSLTYYVLFQMKIHEAPHLYKRYRGDVVSCLCLSTDLTIEPLRTDILIVRITAFDESG